MVKEEEKDYVLDGAKKVMELIEGTLSKEELEKLDNEEDEDDSEDFEKEDNDLDEDDSKDIEKDDIDLDEEDDDKDESDEETEDDNLENLEEDLKAIEKEKKEFLEKGEINEDEDKIDYDLETKEVEETIDSGEDKTLIKFGKTALEELDEEKELEALRKLEAVLFVSGRFLNMQELISYTDTNPLILRELLEKLSDKYENDEASALQIVNKNNLYKMDVKIEYNDVINRLATGRSEFTKAEKETLAIIAYKQPIKQSVVIKIRGNKAYDHIKKYVDLGLIKKKKVGHTNELSLSDEFYDYFGMASSEGDVEEIPHKVSDDEEDEE